ncbi:hypothetical protein D3C73_1242640 [compost metagenome]
MSTGHQQLDTFSFQQGTGDIHPIGHRNHIGMLAHQTGNFIGRSAGIQDHAMPWFDHFSGSLGDTAFNRRIQRALIFNRRLHARRIAVTDQRPTIGTNGNTLLFQKRQIVADRHRRDAK